MTEDSRRGSQRRRFKIALAVFAVWLATLGAMAIFSSTRPKQKVSTGFQEAGFEIRQDWTRNQPRESVQA